jgi:Domain of unknown function (DUF4397)
VNRFWMLLSYGIGLLSLGVVLLSLGCGGSNSTKLRVMNAVPDQSLLTFLLNGNSFAADVAYQTATSYQTVNSGSPQLQIEPSGSSTAIVTQSLSLSGGNNYTVMAVNFSAAHQAPMVLMDQNTAPASGDVSIRMINASPSLGAADVYIVTAGTSIDSVSPTISGLAFAAASSYQSLSASTNYEVIFAPANTKFTVIDSGPLGLTSGQVRTIVGLNSQGGGFTDAVLPDLN